MSTKAETKLDRLRDQTRAEIEKIENSENTEPLPISLRKLARTQNVRSVRFAPIIGSAGLRQLDKDYEIVVNTEAPGTRRLARTVLNIDDPDWDRFEPALRFTVAHEIVHIIMLGLEGGNPKKDVFFRHEGALDTLANELAGRLLMPTKHLIREIGIRLFDAEHLAALADKACVSPQALGIRLSELSIEFPLANGLVGFLREEKGNIVFISGHIWGRPARDRFGIGPAKERDLLEDEKHFPSRRHIEDLKLHPELAKWMREQQDHREEVNIVWRTDPPQMFRKCELHFHRISNEPLGILLTVRLLPEATTS